MVDENLVGKGLSEVTLTHIELYLAAHFALLSLENGPLAKKMVGEANEGYHNVYGKGLLATRFGQQAILFDTTGTLSEIANRAQNTNRRTALFEVVGNNPATDVQW